MEVAGEAHGEPTLPQARQHGDGAQRHARRSGSQRRCHATDAKA
jgi:hypothetical protein